MSISNRLPRLVLALAALAPAACDTPESATSLNPAGPPMIQQVFMHEPDATGRIELGVLAFGTHPDVPAARVRSVTRAAPLGQSIRVVFDELLLGNYLEEVQCAVRTGIVGCPQYSHIPEGATPADIARCAEVSTLDDTCSGPYAVCLNDQAQPCGILDVEMPSRPADGAPDNLRLIAGAVSMRCGNIEVGFDQEASFWQPSGNQLVPAGMTPENSLGPALVLSPLANVLPTSQTDCHLVFAPNVVDKDHVAVCTPANGSLDGACTPGDVSGFTFGTDVLQKTSVQPSVATGVGLLTPVRINLNASVDDNNLGERVTITENGVRRDDVVVRRAGADRNVIQVGRPDGPDTNMDLEPMQLIAGATYVVTADVVDTFGIAPPAPITFTFTTAAP
jgi:hypothetical protein